MGSTSTSAQVDNAGTAFGFGVPGDRALHDLRDLDILDLDQGDLHAHGSVCSSMNFRRLLLSWSRPDSRVSRSLRPSTERSVVWTIWENA